LAFCAGTGVLVYLDLVGHLILRNSLPFIKHNSLDKDLLKANSSFTNLSELFKKTGSEKGHKSKNTP